MKKIIFIIALVFICISFTNAKTLAYTGGVLQGKASLEGETRITDGDINTYATMASQKKYTYVLDNPIDTTETYIWINASGWITGYNTPNGLAIELYDSNNLKISTKTYSIGTQGIYPLNVGGIKKIVIYNRDTYINGRFLMHEFDIIGNEPDILPPNEVTFLSENTGIDNTKLSWVNPIDEDFSHVNIYQDGVFVGKTSSNTFSVTTLEQDRQYVFTVKTVDNIGNESQGVSITVKPHLPVPAPEVNNVEVNTTYNKVELSWAIPQSDKFHHVNIYRDTIETQNPISQIIFGKNTYAASTPLFETNGTYFNDLSVQSSTTYEYTLTTTSVDDVESEGITVQATTLAEPPPEMDGEKVETDQNGDFKVSWTSPTTGKIKILIDGSEYAVVDASLKDYTIPAADMEYDLFGNPKVQLVPISETGKEGEPINPPVDGKAPGSIGVTLPFTATDFLKIVMSLIAWVGPFILLALAIYFAPRIIKFLKGVILKYKEGKLRL